MTRSPQEMPQRPNEKTTLTGWIHAPTWHQNGIRWPCITTSGECQQHISDCKMQGCQGKPCKLKNSSAQTLGNPASYSHQQAYTQKVQTFPVPHMRGIVKHNNSMLILTRISLAGQRTRLCYLLLLLRYPLLQTILKGLDAINT